MAKKAKKHPQHEQKHLKEGGFCNFYTFYDEIAEWIPDGGTWVEVGVYWGESFRWGLVATLNELKGVHMVAIDAFPDGWAHNGTPMVDIFHNHMEPHGGKYQTIRAESSEAAAQFTDSSVDFVFIDANHTREFVRRDIESWQRTIKPGGIIAGHDYNAPHEVKEVVDDIFGDRVITIPSDDFHPIARPFYCWKVQL